MLLPPPPKLRVAREPARQRAQNPIVNKTAEYRWGISDRKLRHRCPSTALPTQAAPGAPDAPEYANMAESAAQEAALADAPIRYAVRFGQLMHAPLYYSSLALTVARLLLRGYSREAVISL
jgi:hypothetical protein